MEQQEKAESEEGASQSQVCIFYLRGKCTRGFKCRFKHTNDPSEVLGAGKGGIGQGDPVLQTVCKFFAEGKCKRGDSCMYKHVEPVGGFRRLCYVCNRPGHEARECPQEEAQGKKSREPRVERGNSKQRRRGKTRDKEGSRPAERRRDIHARGNSQEPGRAAHANVETLLGSKTVEHDNVHDHTLSTTQRREQVPVLDYRRAANLGMKASSGKGASAMAMGMDMYTGTRPSQPLAAPVSQVPETEASPGQYGNFVPFPGQAAPPRQEALPSNSKQSVIGSLPSPGPRGSHWETEPYTFSSRMDPVVAKPQMDVIFSGSIGQQLLQIESSNTTSGPPFHTHPPSQQQHFSMVPDRVNTILGPTGDHSQGHHAPLGLQSIFGPYNNNNSHDRPQTVADMEMNSRPSIGMANTSHQEEPMLPTFFQSLSWMPRAQNGNDALGLEGIGVSQIEMNRIENQSPYHRH